MYKEFYGLKEDPFSISPDPDFMYWSQKHLAAFRHLMYSIHRKKGLILLTGEIGAGKTTLINALMKEIRDRAQIASISNSEIDVNGLFQFIFHQFGLPIEDNKVRNLIKLNDFLLKSRDHNKDIVLILDEAHNFSNEVLEEIRLLSNIETPKEKLLQIILVGQPMLLDRINSIGFEQVKQRVGMSYYLRPLSNVETNFYIKKRLEISGAANASLFTEDAIEEVFDAAKGIPRVINTICDNALLFGAAEKSRQIDAGIIRRVVDSLYLTKSPEQAGTSMPSYYRGEEEFEDVPGDLRQESDVSPYVRIAHLQGKQSADARMAATFQEPSGQRRMTLLITAACLVILVLASLMLAKVEVVQNTLAAFAHSLTNFTKDKAETSQPVNKGSSNTPGQKSEQPSPTAPRSEGPQAAALTDTTPAKSAPGAVKSPESLASVSSLPVRFVNKPEPEYPQVARRLGWEGTTTLLLELRADGTVGEVNVVASSNYPILDEVAKQTAKKWTHVPARRDGVPITQWITQSIPFKLADAGPVQPDAVRQVQERLKTAGFYPGPVDGYLGPRTRDALRRYQESKGLQTTGEVDKATRTALDLD